MGSWPNQFNISKHGSDQPCYTKNEEKKPVFYLLPRGWRHPWGLGVMPTHSITHVHFDREINCVRRRGTHTNLAVARGLNSDTNFRWAIFVWLEHKPRLHVIVTVVAWWSMCFQLVVVRVIFIFMCFDCLPCCCRCIIEYKREFVELFKYRPCASFVHFVSVETMCFVRPFSSLVLL